MVSVRCYVVGAVGCMTVVDSGARCCVHMYTICGDGVVIVVVCYIAIFSVIMFALYLRITLVLFVVGHGYIFAVFGIVVGYVL